MKEKVLAHISARSRKEDDDRAERQLNAYLDFQPARRITCSGSRSSRQLNRPVKRSATSPQKLNAKRAKHEVESLKGGQKLRASRSPTHYLLGQSDCSSDSSSGEIGLRNGPKSALFHLAEAERRWKASQRHVSSIKVNMPSERKDPLDNTQTALSMLQDSIFPDFDPPEPPSMSNSSRAEPLAKFTREFQDPELQSVEDRVTDTDAIPSDQAEEALISPVIPDQGDGSPTNLGSAKIEIPQKSGPKNPDSRPSEELSRAVLANLSRVIKSPATFGEILRLEGTDTFMSRTLQTISFHEDLIRHYRPVTQNRAPQDSERGYWKIDASYWSVRDQVDFWNFLGDQIRHGRAGIATECIRCEEDNEGYDLNDGLGIMRVYCWGELVMHMWLLSFLGCNGAMKKNGGVWISAIDGERLILMP
jgi:hypothetical protein